MTDDASTCASGTVSTSEGDPEIEHVKEVPCTTEHEYELFYVGAIGKRSHPTEDAFVDYMIEYCDPAFDAYIGKADDDSDLDYFWLVPTEDAWRSGDRTVQCAAYDPNRSLLTRSLRGTGSKPCGRTSKTLRGSKVICDSPAIICAGRRLVQDSSAAVAECLPMDATRGGLACPRHVPAEPYAANH